MRFIIARYQLYPTWILWTELEWQRLCFAEQESRSPLEIWRGGECYEYSPEFLP